MKKISQLMREGATMLPQFFGNWFDYDSSYHPIAACAEGCAAYAVTKGQSGYVEEANNIARTLARRQGTFIHPITGNGMYNLHYIVNDLNDHYKWPVKRIADWLESVGE